MDKNKNKQVAETQEIEKRSNAGTFSYARCQLDLARNLLKRGYENPQESRKKLLKVVDLLKDAS